MCELETTKSPLDAIAYTYFACIHFSVATHGLEKKKYYQGKVTPEKSNVKPGSFLVCDNPAHAGSHVLLINVNGTIKEMEINREKFVYVLREEDGSSVTPHERVQHATVRQLIKHYKTNPIHVKEGNISLLNDGKVKIQGGHLKYMLLIILGIV